MTNNFSIFLFAAKLSQFFSCSFFEMRFLSEIQTGSTTGEKEKTEGSSYLQQKESKFQNFTV